MNLISYDDLKRLKVPKETRDFIDNLLDNMAYFSNLSDEIQLDDGSEVAKNEENGYLGKGILYILFYTMYHDNQLLNYMSMFNLPTREKSFTKIDVPKASGKKRKYLFAKNSYLFNVFENMDDYHYLHPLMILNAHFKKRNVIREFDVPIKSIEEKLYPSIKKEMEQKRRQKYIDTLGLPLTNYLEQMSYLETLTLKENNSFTSPKEKIFFLFCTLLAYKDEKDMTSYEERKIYLCLKANFSPLDSKDALDFIKKQKDILVEYKDKINYGFISKVLEFYPEIKSITDLANSLLLDEEIIKDKEKSNSIKKYLFAQDYEKYYNFYDYLMKGKYPVFANYLSTLLVIHHQIECQRKEKRVSSLIKSDEDVTKISMFLLLFIDDYWISYLNGAARDISTFIEEEILKKIKKNQECLEKYGLSLAKICTKLNIEIKTNYQISNEVLIEIFNRCYQNYHSAISSLKEDFTTFCECLFDKKLNSSTILEDFFKEENYPLERLKVELITGCDYEETLSNQERLEALSTLEKETLDSKNVNSILNFGNILTKYTKYVTDSMMSLTKKDTIIETTDSINQMINRLKVKNKEKQSFFRRIFSHQEEVESVEITSESIKQLESVILDYSKILSREIQGFDYLRQYIIICYRKNLEYLQVIDDELRVFKEKLDTLEKNEEEYFEDTLSLGTTIKVLANKKNTFDATNQLLKQELVKIHQMITNHFIMFNSLEISKNTLLPLIVMELSIGKGLSSEEGARRITNGLVYLLQDLVIGNQEKIVNGIEQMKKMGVSDEVYQVLTKDVLSFSNTLSLKTNSSISMTREDAKEISSYLEKQYSLVSEQDSLVVNIEEENQEKVYRKK